MRMTLLNAGLTAACLIAGLGVTVTGAFADDERTFSVVSRADDGAEGDFRALRVPVDSDNQPDQDSRASAAAKPSAVTPAATTNSVSSTINTTTATAPSAIANASPTPAATNAGPNGSARGSGSAAPVGVVPEPETYAMMALGVVLMGFVARRRKG